MASTPVEHRAVQELIILSPFGCAGIARLSLEQVTVRSLGSIPRGGANRKVDMTDLLDAASATVKEYYSDAEYIFGIGGWREYDDGSGRRLANLRLDTVEIPIDQDTFDFNTLSPEHLDIIWAGIKAGLVDLFKNGDINGNDAWLKIFDGSIVRNQTLIDVTFSRVSLYRTLNQSSSMVEYTLYAVVDAHWQ